MKFSTSLRSNTEAIKNLKIYTHGFEIEVKEKNCTISVTKRIVTLLRA